MNVRPEQRFPATGINGRVPIAASIILSGCSIKWITSGIKVYIFGLFTQAAVYILYRWKRFYALLVLRFQSFFPFPRITIFLSMKFTIRCATGKKALGALLLLEIYTRVKKGKHRKRARRYVRFISEGSKRQRTRLILF